MNIRKHYKWMFYAYVDFGKHNSMYVFVVALKQYYNLQKFTKKSYYFYPGTRNTINNLILQNQWQHLRTRSTNVLGCGGVLQKLCLCLFIARGDGSERSQANTYAYMYSFTSVRWYCRCPHAGPVLLNDIATHNFTNLPQTNCVALSKRVRCLYSLSHLQGTIFWIICSYGIRCLIIVFAIWPYSEPLQSYPFFYSLFLFQYNSISHLCA